jgi:NAD(P)-dependent dehydrogenase (short-subunit alcohol dehydrogenase family)
VTGRLEGKRALVVGAGSGIGRAVVDAFVAEGAAVAALELDPAKAAALGAEQPTVLVVAGDASLRDDAQRAVDAAVAGLDGIDVLVSCVGLFDFYRGLRDLDDDELDAGFDEAFRVNVKSQLLVVKAALPPLTEARGSIILTVSTSGFAPGRGGILYVASKFAVRGVVTALAHELAPAIRVNGVAPGGTLGTDLRGLAGLGLGDRRLDDTPGRADAMRRRTPLEVALTAADHAGSYVFLASQEARGMTGTFLHPDGGMAARG